MKCFIRFLTAVALLTISAAANAQGITAWEAAATTAGAGYTNTNIAAPMQDDIGAYDDTTNGGVTYEFIVNADVGGREQCLHGFTKCSGGNQRWLEVRPVEPNRKIWCDHVWRC